MDAFGFDCMCAMPLATIIHLYSGILV